VISDRLLRLVRCPACHSALAGDPSSLHCVSCGLMYASESKDFLDLRPHEAFVERTKYLDEALHADARYDRVSPALLGSKIRNDMLRAFLAPSPNDLVVDLGCGSGRAILWNSDWQAQVVGIDISPFFAQEARAGVDLLLGDLRRLPFADGTFTRAYSLDVLEHLSPAALGAMLREAARVLAPGGQLFVYTHVRRNAAIARGLRAINGLVHWLERKGRIDARQERLRKSDHLNPLADIPELRRVVADAGFRIRKIRYYTPIIGGFVENVIIRLAEKRLADRARGAAGAGRTGGARAEDVAGASAGMTDEEALKAARAEGKERVAKSATTRAVLRALTAAMKLDLLLFGRIESGPFFALLERTPDHRPPTSDLRPLTSDPRAPTSDLRPPTSEPRAQTSDPRPPTSEAR
jgi:SAM-dependent methyltransferase